MKKTEAMKFQNLVILIILLIMFMITLTFYAISGINEHKVKKDVKSFTESGIVSRVIDGDTFELDNGKIIRLLCINAPEKDELGFIESKYFLESLVLGKEVLLSNDKEDKDKYKRYLRYVYLVPENDLCSENTDSDNELTDTMCINNAVKVFVNKEIIKNKRAVLESYGNSNCNVLMS